MRARRSAVAVAGVLATCAAAYAGCGTYYDDLYVPLTDPRLETDAGDAGNPACDLDPTTNAEAVIDDCGVFVSASAAPGGDGTKERPFASLQEGIDNAGGKHVYACTNGAFAEAVTIGTGIDVIGGFDCDAEWMWSAAARSTIDAPAGSVALTLTAGADGAKVQSFSVNAASATAMGGSSIGVAVADVNAELVQVDVTAGDGIDGESGTTPTGAPTPGTNAPAMMDPGAPTAACVVPAGVAGGLGGVTTCDDGETRGGVGGLGGITGTDNGNGQAGMDGQPLPNPNPNDYGLGGTGQIDPMGVCTQGEPGGPGASGAPGAGGTSGTVTLTGIAGADGGNGITGTRGQGGGGGGGAKSGVFCTVGMNTVDGPGASGGGGGAGGCGGKGGRGGKAGGSSIGIVSLGTKLVLTEVSVSAGKGGKGGDGAGGQGGALGGNGATGGAPSGQAGSKQGCAGGSGGQGGDGGPGGGARGGSSIGIAYGAAPTEVPSLKSFTPGTPGAGGNAGLGAPPESNGAAGANGACWDFAANAACGG